MDAVRHGTNPEAGQRRRALPTASVRPPSPPSLSLFSPPLSPYLMPGAQRSAGGSEMKDFACRTQHIFDDYFNETSNQRSKKVITRARRQHRTIKERKNLKRFRFISFSLGNRLTAGIGELWTRLRPGLRIARGKNTA